MSDRPKARQRKALPGGRRSKKNAPAQRPPRWPLVLLSLEDVSKAVRAVRL